MIEKNGGDAWISMSRLFLKPHTVALLYLHVSFIQSFPDKNSFVLLLYTCTQPADLMYKPISFIENTEQHKLHSESNESKFVLKCCTLFFCAPESRLSSFIYSVVWNVSEHYAVFIPLLMFCFLKFSSMVCLLLPPSLSHHCELLKTHRCL